MVLQSHALNLTMVLYLLLSNITKTKFPVILKYQRIAQASVIISLYLGGKKKRKT